MGPFESIDEGMNQPQLADKQLHELLDIDVTLCQLEAIQTVSWISPQTSSSVVFVCAFVGTSGELDGKPEVGRHVNFVDDVRSTLRQGKRASFKMPCL